MNKYIKSDLYRYCGKTDILHFFSWFFRYTTFRYMTWHRLYNYGGPIGRFFAKIYFVFGKKRYLVIPKELKVGYGLYIGHNGPIVINKTAKIGNNVNLSQFTTIGSNEDHAATIGDNVYIGPSVCIIEDVKIGDNATIGAGSVVTKDIPDNATAAGNYAKVLNYNNPGRYIQNKWKI